MPSIGREALQSILVDRRAGRPPTLEPAADAASLARLFAAVDRVFLPRAVTAFIARVVHATHPTSDLANDRVKRYVRFGASPRAAIAIAEAARAHALMSGKPNAGFDDVRAVAKAAMAHRLVLDYKARLDGVTGADIVRETLAAVGELEETLPNEVADAG